MTRADAMKNLLDHLLGLPENADGLGAQIVTTASASTVISGAIKHGPVPGIYNIRNVAEIKETKSKVMLDCYLSAEDIIQLQVMIKADEQLIQPVGGKLIL